MRAGRRRFDGVRAVAVLLTGVAVAVLVGMAVFLVVGSLPALRHEGWRFLLGNDWSYRRGTFGAAAMVYGTAAVSAVAILLAAPVGIGTAVFASEIGSRRVRMGLKVLVELLAGIPSVIYGLLGVLYLRNWIFALLDRGGVRLLSGDTLLTAGVLLAVMILPTVATLSDDALQGVPAATREAARGLGLTRAETTLGVVLPQALPGLVGAVLLALGRALGETIAVFLVVGRADNLLPASLASLRPLVDAGQTITSKLGGSEVNLAVGDPLHASALLALGLVLMGGVLLLTFAAGLLRRGLAAQGAR